MDVQVEAELMALCVMAAVIFLKTAGFYYAKKRSEPGMKFDPSYAVTAMLGLLAAYAAYTVNTTDIFEVFRSASVYALGFNLLFDVPGKFKKE